MADTESFDSASFDTVSLSFDGDVTTLTLDRPDQENAIDPEMIFEMQGEVLPRLEADARNPEGGTNVLVVTGAGEAFCGGMDLKEFFLTEVPTSGWGPLRDCVEALRSRRHRDGDFKGDTLRVRL